jgi:hypothetical protein
MHATHFTPRIFFLSVFVCITTFVFAQRKTITGIVRDSAANTPLANVQVSNLTGNKKTTTDNKGNFSISADVNDVLFFTKDGYRFRTFQYSLLMDETLDVRMAVLPHELPGVTVQTSYSKYQSDSIKRSDEFNKELVSPEYKAVSNNPNGAGATVNLDFFTKREKSKRKAVKLFAEHEQDAYVHYRFSPELVGAYTGLKGDSLNRFINLYSPDYKWLRQHTSDEDVFYYINDKLKVFYKRKQD